MKFRNLHSFRLQDPSLDAGGTGVVDRGDLLPDPAATPPITPPVKDPKVQELETDLGLGEAEHEDGEGAKPTKDTRIPAARHKEILEKERAKTAAALAELTRLQQAQQREVVEVDAQTQFADAEARIEKLEGDYASLLVDGETAKAAEVRKQIRAAERGMAEAKADLKIQAAAIANQQTAQFQIALTRIETAYPVLNPDHEDFDSVVEQRVTRMNSANRAAGMGAVAALQDAVETVLGTATAAQEKATSVTPRAPKDAGAERKAEAVAKAVKAVNATPPALSGVGANSDRAGGGKYDSASIAGMTQTQFAALSAEDLAAARGDTI